MTPPSVIIVGGGIAGAGLAYALAGHADVTLLERDSYLARRVPKQPVANFVEPPGTAVVRQLAAASRPFLEAPPPNFTTASIRIGCGAVTIAGEDRIEALALRLAAAREQRSDARAIDLTEAGRRFPILRPGYAAWAMLEPDSAHVNAHALHHGYLQGLRGRSGRVVTDAHVVGMRRIVGRWTVETAASGRFYADVVVNAAGASADKLAAMAGIKPLGLRAKRCLAIMLDIPLDIPPNDWPLLRDISGDLCVSADANALFISIPDIRSSASPNAAPAEEDVVAAIARLQRATTVTAGQVRHAWAGLRSFAQDQNPVVGVEHHADGFVWLAAQGGAGIKASPAISRIAAAAVLDQCFPADLAALGLRAAELSPQRLRLQQSAQPKLH
ncbi:FAD-binding oxidoreductase [Acidisphaera sp. L21]|uniref:NAD(P)/FAD-dependent oxidoreductase n=1 Tax=Acidisphaera sp. L21 TaxID=1641851 RepID=UPI00131AA737|nr:FAD-binding oxidoreductase [Acidisphaera sp. L21]